MPTLADIQATFVGALKEPKAAVPEAVGRKNGLPAKRRFDVYRNNVAAGMIEALRATYPAIETLVGADFFAASARVYLDRHPPRSPMLFRYGAGFGDFLDGFPPAASTPYLGDVARLEWARLQAYHARDAKPLTIEALGRFLQDRADDDVEADSLCFALHPSLTLLESRWPMVSLWAASTGQASSDDVNMKTPEKALIIRPSLAVETHRLPKAGFVFMSAIADGARLADATHRAAASASDFDLTAHLQGLFAVGAVSAINDQAT